MVPVDAKWLCRSARCLDTGAICRPNCLHRMLTAKLQGANPWRLHQEQLLNTRTHVLQHRCTRRSDPCTMCPGLSTQLAAAAWLCHMFEP